MDPILFGLGQSVHYDGPLPPSCLTLQLGPIREARLGMTGMKAVKA